MYRGRSLRVLEKCRNMKELKQTHAQIITSGLANDNFALSRLMAFCSDPTHGSLSYARLLFHRLDRPTLCICNTMIKAFLLHKQFTKAIETYVNMVTEHCQLPDNYTLPYVLKSCALLEAHETGEQVHVHVLKLGFGFDEFVSNSLIKMYAGCDDIMNARKVFDDMLVRTQVSWTVIISGYSKIGEVEIARLLFDEAPVKDRGIWGAMISGYVQNNCFKEGLWMFQLMQLENLEADEGLLASILCACAQVGALDLGIWVHGYVGWLRLPLSVRLGTALMDMYVKCGCLDSAKKVFDKMKETDVVCWNVMILGLAMHGDAEGVFKLFSEMKDGGFSPDDVTLIAVFTACGHLGRAEEGLLEFNQMKAVYGIEPKGEHYGCVVDFLGRAGLIEEALEIIHRMPTSSSPSEQAIAWRALLSACRNHGETRLAEIVAERLLQLERHTGVYVLLSNIYAASGKYIDAKNVRRMMTDGGLQKTPGCSLIEVNGSVHEFIAGEKMHPYMEEIFRLLEKMNEHLEYVGANHVQ